MYGTTRMPNNPDPDNRPGADSIIITAAEVDKLSPYRSLPQARRDAARIAWPAWIVGSIVLMLGGMPLEGAAILAGLGALIIFALLTAGYYLQRPRRPAPAPSESEPIIIREDELEELRPEAPSPAPRPDSAGPVLPRIRTWRAALRPGALPSIVPGPGMPPVEAPASEAVCLYCGDRLFSRSVYECPQCKTQHHEDCWQANAGCTNYGCPENPQSLRL